MSDRGDRLPVILLEVLPVLAARFGWDFLRYQARRKRGVRAFRRALLRSGMSRDRVEVLTRAYHDVGSSVGCSGPAEPRSAETHALLLRHARSTPRTGETFIASNRIVISGDTS